MIQLLRKLVDTGPGGLYEVHLVVVVVVVVT